MTTGKNSVKPALAFASVLFLIALVIMTMLSLQTKIVFAATNQIGANLVVPNTCIPILSNTVVAFGSVGAGSYAQTQNAVNVINFGNANSVIYVDGGNWIGTTYAFHVSNTLWSATSLTYPSQGAALTNSVLGVNTLIPIIYNGGGNVIFYGMNVPSLQGNGLYSQTINIMLSC